MLLIAFIKAYLFSASNAVFEAENQALG
jgi:hypothetical protein